MNSTLPACPSSLKAVQHYLKTAADHEQRDAVVAYWCRVYALQLALKIDKKSHEARSFLVALMDWLENAKKIMSDNEAITNEVAAQAHIENYALKIFTWADSQDRAGVFNKNIIRSFYSAGMLMDVLNTFGELSDEIARSCKYAKWKAAYINNCLKNGETPIPGPMESENDDTLNDEISDVTNQSNIGFQIPNTHNTPPNQAFTPVSGGGLDSTQPDVIKPPITAPSSVPVAPASNYVAPPAESSPGNSTVTLSPSLTSKVQKCCKFAISSLDYDDVNEAIKNLEMALKLLKTGTEL